MNDFPRTLKQVVPLLSVAEAKEPTLNHEDTENTEKIIKLSELRASVVNF